MFLLVIDHEYIDLSFIDFANRDKENYDYDCSRSYFGRIR